VAAIPLTGHLSDEAQQCAKCGEDTLRRLDLMAGEVVLQSWALCDTCQIPYPWGQTPAIWTESTETIAPLEVVPHS
jgi:hypothetical protein